MGARVGRSWPARGGGRWWVSAPAGDWTLGVLLLSGVGLLVGAVVFAVWLGFEAILLPLSAADVAWQVRHGNGTVRDVVVEKVTRHLYAFGLRSELPGITRDHPRAG